jgi:hypothetical protein
MRAMTMIPAMAVVLAASPLHAQSTSPQSATLDSIAPQIEAGFTTFMAETMCPVSSMAWCRAAISHW